MRQSIRALALGAALIAGVFGSGLALSQDKAKVVAERQELMKQHGRLLLVVRNYFQGKADQQAAITAVQSLLKTVPTVPEHFPPGTGIGEVPVKTRAKPEIWKEHDKFLADDKTVLGQITTLDAAVKSGDKSKVEAVFKEIAFCESCHRDFRAKEQ